MKLSTREAILLEVLGWIEKVLSGFAFGAGLLLAWVVFKLMGGTP